MDFQSFKRRDLQYLCKKNNIPANITNAAMADALASLTFVEGLEEYLGRPESEARGSPERSVLTSPVAPPTTTRGKALKEDVESSKLATRTRCGTKTKAKEGIDTRKTPATRTARRRACQDASVKKEMEKDLQADFEADLEQSEVSVESVLLGGELKEISEEVSEVRLENEEQLSENHSATQIELQQSNDGEEVIDVDDLDVNEVQEEPSEINVDFHSLARKDLQNLCKKNKIPANMTNAAMADALASLETVEGLQEVMKGNHFQALSSPLVSGVATSCARRSRTTVKITKEEPRSSKMITKSCRGSRRRILEEDEEVKNDLPETPVDLALCERESSQKKEESADSGIELKQMDISCMGNIESLVVFSNAEIEDQETSDSSNVGELTGNANNILVGKDNVLNSENLKEPEEGLATKTDENAVEESSGDAEAFIVVGESSDNPEVSIFADPQLVANCSPQLENLKLCSRDGESENTQTQKSETLEIDADSESDDHDLEDMVNASALPAKDKFFNGCISESFTHINQVLSSESKKSSTFDSSKLETVDTVTSSSAAQAIPVAAEVGSQEEDELCEKSDSMSTAQADEANSSGESDSEGSYTEDMSDNSDDSDFAEVGSQEEDELCEKSDSMSTAQADKLSPNSSGESDSKGSYTEDNSDDSDFESESEGSYPEEKLSKKSDIEITNQFDKRQEVNSESESDGSCTEDDMTADSDSEVESESSFTEDDLSVKSDIETTTQGDKLPEINAESKSEGSYTEDQKFDSELVSQDQDANVDIDPEEKQLSAKSDIETSTQGDKLPEINLASECQGSCAEDQKFESDLMSGDLDINVDTKNYENQLNTGSTEAELCAPSETNQLEEVETTNDLASYGHAVSSKIDTEANQVDLCPPTGQDTPLEFKSLRKLKRILKEKLQAVAVTKGMENLTLEEDLHESGEPQDEALSNDLVNDDSKNEAIKNDVNATTLVPVDVIVDNEVIPEAAIIGDINVVACPPQSTPNKLSSNIKQQPLLFTPPSKKQMSAGRKNCVMDVNKENIIDSAASRTEPGKVKVAITESGKLLATMSMGKLKKEFKVLQQSEKKRQALQSRSENNCFLTSP